MKYGTAFFAFIITAYLTISGCATVNKSPLLAATTKGDPVAVQNLIKAGANVNEPDSNGDTPLAHAIWARKKDTAKALINMGADINKPDSYSGYTPLLSSLSYKYIDIAKLLIDKGADIHHRGYDGSNALILAISADSTELANLLIDKGIDLNVADSGGITPLIQAAAYGNFEIAKKLIDKKVNVFSTDESGYKASDYVKFSLRPAKRIFKSENSTNRNLALLKMIREAENTQIASGQLNLHNTPIGRAISIVHKVKTCMNSSEDYSVFISPKKEVNAWVNVSGNITFTQSALEKLDDDTLTFIAAHEIAHDKLGHVADKIAVSYATTGVMLVANAFIPGIGLLNHVINPAITNNYSKYQEYDADKLAVESCTRCFNMTIEKQALMMQKIKDTSKSNGGGFWATHPSWNDRIKNIENKDPS